MKLLSIFTVANSTRLLLVLTIPLLVSLREEPPPLPIEKPYFDTVFNRLVQAESDGLWHAYSRKGAIGACQIMPIGLREYNRLYRTNLTTNQLWNPVINKMIGRGLLKRLVEKYGYVKAVNSYNMGVGNTDNNYWYYSYLEEIIPWEWHLYKARHGVISVRSKTLSIGIKYGKVRNDNKYKVASIP